jgi:hypothetical protein
MAISLSWAVTSSGVITISGTNSTGGTANNFSLGNPLNPASAWIFANVGVPLKKTSYSAEIDAADLFRQVLTRGWAKSEPVLNFLTLKM